MVTRLIYLEYGFWQAIIKDESVQGKKIFWEIYSALEQSDICANIPNEIWEEDDNPLYYLIQNSADGYGTTIDMNNPERIKTALNKESKQTIDNLCAIYLLDENGKKCEEYGHQLGILCLNATTVRNRSSYVFGDAVDYKKGENYDGYSKCSEFLSPCNSLIIIDPYILKGNWNPRFATKTNSIELNLIPLLQKIIPQQIEIPFHLSIFSQAYGCVIDTNNNANGEEVFNYLDKKIHELWPNIIFSLYHIKTTGDGDGDFHSRHILTNNMAINAEDGFDLFKNKYFRKTNTNKCVCGKYARIEFVHPTLSNNRRLETSCYIQWIKIASDNSVDATTRNPKKCWGWGTLENRLFDLVK